MDSPTPYQSRSWFWPLASVISDPYHCPSSGWSPPYCFPVYLTGRTFPLAFFPVTTEIPSSMVMQILPSHCFRMPPNNLPSLSLGRIYSLLHPMGNCMLYHISWDSSDSRRSTFNNVGTIDINWDCPLHTGWLVTVGMSPWAQLAPPCK